jgi:hypothetical protein
MPAWPVYRSVDIIDETTIFDIGYVGYTLSMFIYAQNVENEVKD